MPAHKRQRLDSVAAAIQQRHGPQALRLGSTLDDTLDIPHISTTFPALDAITGCGGFPVGAMTLLTGRSTSGKLTLAYKLLASAQRSVRGDVAYNVGLLDLSRTADPDYVARCGVHLDALLVARPAIGPQTVQMLGDMIQTYQLRAVVVDCLADLAVSATALRALNGMLGRLQQLLRTMQCTVVLLDEPRAPWVRWMNLDRTSQVRWSSALHLEMRREQWLHKNGALVGYRAQARLLKSRWVYGIRSAPVEIVFNGVVRRRESW